MPKFTLAFNINITNEERLELLDLYQRAFGAKKLSQEGEDIHIMMEIFGTGILIGPGSEDCKCSNNKIICEARFEDEKDFRIAYDALIEEGQNYSLEGPYPWATLLGLVTDKFGIGWALYYNEN